MEKLAQGNAAFVLDILCGRLAYERTGITLYDTAIQKIERDAEPRYHAVVGQLREIRDEEQEHADWLEVQIRTLGGNPDEMTSLKKLVTDETEGIVRVITEGHRKPIEILHALLAAELVDNAGWDVLVKLADEAGDRLAKIEFEKRLAEEIKHLAFMREAVVRAATIELLGQEKKMPAGMRDVVVGMARPMLRGGLIGAGLVGLGALLASVTMTFRPNLIQRSRRLLRAA